MPTGDSDQEREERAGRRKRREGGRREGGKQNMGREKREKKDIGRKQGRGEERRGSRWESRRRGGDDKVRIYIQLLPAEAFTSATETLLLYRATHTAIFKP